MYKSIVTEFLDVSKILALAFVVLVLASCESVDPDENNNNNDTIPYDTLADFRDKLTGNYSCIETYTYFDPINDTIMNWTTDTISLTALVSVRKYQDTTLEFTIGSYSFIGSKVSENKFECLECNGPPDYAEFYSNDSIYIFLKQGVTNNKDFFGKKQ